MHTWPRVLASMRLPGALTCEWTAHLYIRAIRPALTNLVAAASYRRSGGDRAFYQHGAEGLLWQGRWVCELSLTELALG